MMKVLEQIDITREAPLSQKESKNEWVLDALCELTQVRKAATASLRYLSGQTGFGTHSVRGALRRLQDVKRISRSRRFASAVVRAERVIVFPVRGSKIAATHLSLCDR